MTAKSNLPRSNKAVEKAHAVLREHYGDEVRPIHEVCQAIQTWLDAIRDEHGSGNEDEHRDETLHRIALAYESVGFTVPLQASKSNLLYRLLYLRQPLRTEKCPVHDGHWAGYPGFHDEPCACQVGLDITGWLPK